MISLIMFPADFADTADFYVLVLFVSSVLILFCL